MRRVQVYKLNATGAVLQQEFKSPPTVFGTLDTRFGERIALKNGVSGELLATDLRRAQHHLGEITGRITPELVNLLVQNGAVI